MLLMGRVEQLAVDNKLLPSEDHHLYHNMWNVSPPRGQCQHFFNLPPRLRVVRSCCDCMR